MSSGQSRSFWQPHQVHLEWRKEKVLEKLIISRIYCVETLLSLDLIENLDFVACFVFRKIFYPQLVNETELSKMKRLKIFITCLDPFNKFLFITKVLIVLIWISAVWDRLLLLRLVRFVGRSRSRTFRRRGRRNRRGIVGSWATAFVVGFRTVAFVNNQERAEMERMGLIEIGKSICVKAEVLSFLQITKGYWTLKSIKFFASFLIYQYLLQYEP